MKKVMTCLLLFTSLLSLSQDQDSTFRKPNTEIEKVVIKIGTVIKKEFINVYTNTPKGIFTDYGNVEVKILNLTDASSKITISGLSISNSSGYSSFIDLDEIPGLLKFIELLNKIDSEKPENYTEYIFNSKDLQIYAYFSSDTYKKAPLYWHYGIKIDKYYSRSGSRVELKVLNEIREAIINSKSKFSILPDF